jgi:hypothetical protein
MSKDHTQKVMVWQRGHRGGIIPVHRALSRFLLHPSNLITSSLVALGFGFAWLVLLSNVCRFWKLVFVIGLRYLPLGAELDTTSHWVTPYIHFDLPYLRVTGALPSTPVWWLTTAATALLLLLSYLLPFTLVPLAYLLRLLVAVQATSLLYFAITPANFPHSASGYMESLANFALALISSVPGLFGATYFIFNFGITKKAFLTLVTMSHLVLFMPLVMLLQALLLQISVMFMPLLYILFSIGPAILIIIAFYSWGMSWNFVE